MKIINILQGSFRFYIENYRKLSVFSIINCLCCYASLQIASFCSNVILLGLLLCIVYSISILTEYSILLYCNKKCSYFTPTIKFLFKNSMLHFKNYAFLKIKISFTYGLLMQLIQFITMALLNNQLFVLVVNLLGAIIYSRFVLAFPIAVSNNTHDPISLASDYSEKRTLKIALILIPYWIIRYWYSIVSDIIFNQSTTMISQQFVLFGYLFVIFLLYPFAHVILSQIYVYAKNNQTSSEQYDL